MIKISNLNKYFNKGKSNEIHVINDVNLQLPEKGMVAIFGKSGCGKTTLLNVIGGLDKYDGGSLMIEEKVMDGGDEMRNQYVGYIFQNYNLHSGQTCFENVANALRLCGIKNKDVIEERVIAALKNVDMEKYKNRTPDTLSGGQQQRIAIARAIVKNPRIILADEPTGNLDEANTVMVMDLLKKISKDHLVLVVTHEANLVDHYCDKVIELSDGKVISERLNSGAKGFASRDKSDIYLGELQKTELLGAGANVEIYGDKPQTPINIKIVNSGGKLYLQVNTPKVQILDEFSEVKLKEGVFQIKPELNTVSQNIDMSKLPPVQGKNFGKLFNFKNAFKSGYSSNVSKRKKGNGFLRVLMALFAVIIVFMTSAFGVMFSQLEQIDSSYNHNVFYVDDYDATKRQTLFDAVGNQDSFIDLVRPTDNKDSHEFMTVMAGYFETYNNPTISISSVVYFDETICASLPIVVGKNTNLEGNDAVITTAVADAVLEAATVGYINDYNDLVGYSVYVDGSESIKIAGVVRSTENSVYFSRLTLAKLLSVNYYLAPASDYQMTVPAGQTALVFSNEILESEMFPQQGDSIKINGQDFVVNQVTSRPNLGYNDYAYVLNDEDYIALYKLIGECHSTAEGYYYQNTLIVHSANPSKTEEYLLQTLGKSYFDSYVTTPEQQREESLQPQIAGIMTNAISLVVIIGVMSLCMYFIMRSSLMLRIKEIGIYRAIGVTKKNLVFRFFIEALALTTFTVFIGYLCASAFLFICLGASSLVAQVLYYPVWLAIAVLVVLYAVCLVCGVLPILTLLSKTPSQILAKYDI